MSVWKSYALAERQLKAEKRRGSKKGISNYSGVFMFSGAVLLYGIFVLAVCLALGEPRSADGNRVLTYENMDQVLEGNGDGRADSYQVTMSTEWKFDGKSLKSVEAYVENVKGNSDTVYFVLTPVDAPDHILYLSPELEPGENLTEIKLEKPLPQGVNDCVVTYYVSDESMPAEGISVGVRVRVL